MIAEQHQKPSSPVNAETESSASSSSPPPPPPTIVASKFLPYPTKFRYPSSLLDSLKASLERTGLSSFDLYQIHGPISLRSADTIADALSIAHKAGYIKTVGVSNYSINEMTRMHSALAKRGIQLAVNQVEFSLLRTLPLKSGLIQAAKILGVTILAYS